MKKIKPERIECYYKKGRDYWFYVDFPRNASKEDEAIRKAFGAFIKGKHGTEGRGYHWRVSVRALREAIDFLPDPPAIKAEMQRFDREGVKKPEHPYHVETLKIWDTERPTMISLVFEIMPEAFRRACNYWLDSHHITQHERERLNLFGGRSMTVVADMITAFESWLEFEKPWRELYKEAFAERKQQEEEQKQKQWEADAVFRAQYKDWDAWPEYERNEVRWEARRAEREAEYERIRQEFKDHYSYQHYHFTFPGTSKIDEAFQLLGLSKSATLQDLKKQYRMLSKRYHPDIPGGDETMFKKINNANELLVQHLGG